MTIFVLLWTEGRFRRILHTGSDAKQFALVEWRNTSEIVNVTKCTQVHDGVLVKTTTLTVKNGGA